MKHLHFCAGTQSWNGMAVLAQMLVQEELLRKEDSALVDSIGALSANLDADVEDVCVHGAWLPVLWRCAAKVLKNRRALLIWYPHGSYDPVRLRYHGWKKWLAGPIERYLLRRCDKIVATCEAEKCWIEAYLGKRCPKVEVIDVKRFFSLGDRSWELGVREDFSRKERKDRKEDEGNGSKQETGNKKLNLLYLGRRHPLKGVEFLEAAVAELGGDSRSRESKSNIGIGNSFEEKNLSVNCSTLNFDSKQIELRIVSNAFGEEKERVWDWCDVLVLPTLSENFALVVAEALERGKRVITTDGAPAWGENGRLEAVDFSRKERKGRKKKGEDSSELEKREELESEIWSGYGGRLLYLKGYRDGTREKRVALLKKAIVRVVG